MKCPTCNGKKGWGHYSIEHDYRGREVRVGGETFFACDTCRGTGEVSVTALRQSLLAEEERQRAFDKEMGDYHSQWEQELRREEWQRSMGNRQFNQL